jgi:hypothetical protein
MKPEISCFYSTNCLFEDSININITFVRYDQYFRVIFNDKSIAITIDQLMSSDELFQVYILSLLLTENTTEIVSKRKNNKIVYGVSTNLYSKGFLNYKFIMIEKLPHKNPMNMEEPKRSSGPKKLRKLMKMFYNMHEGEMFLDPIILLNEYYKNETEKISEFVKKETEKHKRIEILSNILHNYGRDIYSSIRKYLH